MKGWPALMDQAARRLVAEIEKLDPANAALMFARSVFGEADGDGIKPAGRPPGGKQAAARERRAARDAADEQAARLYASGWSIIETARKLGKSPGFVRGALQRRGVVPRPPGGRVAARVDFERVERIRAARAETPPKSLQEIATAEGISRERVRQICTANDIEHGWQDRRVS